MAGVIAAASESRAAERPDLRVVEAALPILADLLRSDVVLYERRDDNAVGIAAVAPLTVPSVFANPPLGLRLTRHDEPAVIRALASGRPTRRLSRALVRGTPTVQDVFPIWRERAVVGAVAFEAGVIEHERHRRKSPVFRRALDRFRQAALNGQLSGVGDLARLGEHDGPLVVDANGAITYISSVAENLYRKLGYTQSLLSRNVAHLQTDESIFFEALESGVCLQKSAQEGRLIWMRWALPLPSARPDGLLSRFARHGGRLDGVLVIIRDVTEERRTEQELKIKSAMIQEIHHRVKNNLQTIASLLRLQARRTGSPEVSDMLRETINRILSIAVVHEFLAHDEAAIVDVKEICQRILTEVAQGILDPEKQIHFTIEGPDLPLPAQQATSCALVINELLQNAVRHAFPGRTEGRVVVRLDEEPNDLRIEIVDDGRGVEPGFDDRRGRSLGLHIVRTLVGEDLQGQFRIANNADGGVRATITFPRCDVAPRPGSDAQR